MRQVVVALSVARVRGFARAIVRGLISTSIIHRGPLRQHVDNRCAADDVPSS